MNKKATNKHREELFAKREIESISGESNRARSVTVGTAFGGTTEVMMRKNDGTVVFAIMQPVEVIELIHQLAANVGCHLHLTPRRDFASWREWRVTEEERLHLNGHPPFPNDMALHMNVGANLPAPEHQPGLNFNRSEQYEEVVATEKNINKRTSKRSSKTA